MRVLVWFRSDLRVEDNLALAAAASVSTHGVVAAFLPSPDQWLEHDWGAPKQSFVLRGVASLSESLRNLNIPLLIRHAPSFAEAPQVIERLCREQQCDAMYFNKEYELNEARRDEAVSRRLAAARISIRGFDDQVLIPPGSLRTLEGRFYTVFTPFRKAATARLLEVPPKISPAPRVQSALVCDPDPPPSMNHRAGGRTHAELWPATEKEAQERLGRFMAGAVQDYDTKRNFPALEGTSALSPYLSAGLLSPRQCLVAAAKANRGHIAEGAEGPTTWISELLWREFYRHLLVGFPRLSMGRAFKPLTEHLDWDVNPEHLKAWCDGRTGVPIVDAAMRQMAETGWMHNRARMIAAMYLTKDLFISWREGERHFMRSLVDADLAQNNGGWQWAASTGTDAAPYFRIFNYESQAKRYDPQAEYIHRWVPELRAVSAPEVHALSHAAPSRLRALSYPPPLVDHRQARARVLAAFMGLTKA